MMNADDFLTEQQKAYVVFLLENQMDEAALKNDDEHVKEIATIIRKLGGGQ